MILRDWVHETSQHAKVEVGKLVLLIAASGLLLSSGIAALSRLIGYPLAALAFSALLFLLALSAQFLRKRRSIHYAHRMAHARNRTETDLAMAASVARSALPMLPIVAFVAAFNLARRK